MPWQSLGRVFRLVFSCYGDFAVKAAELYRRWSSLVEEDWARYDLVRLSGRGCRWFADRGDSALLVFVVSNPKHAWTVQGGGNFSINAYQPKQKPDEPEKYIESVFDNVRFFSLWRDDLSERRMAANRRVYEKIRDLDKDELFAKMAEAYDCTPAQAKQSGLYQTELEIIGMQLEDSGDALINPPLFFYDSDDIEAWAELVTSAMPEVLESLKRGAAYSFDLGGTT